MCVCVCVCQVLVLHCIGKGVLLSSEGYAREKDQDTTVKEGIVLYWRVSVC